MGATELPTSAQVADLLGLKPVSLTMMRRRGTGPPYLKALGKHKYLYRRDALEAWVKERGYAEFLALRNGDR